MFGITMAALCAPFLQLVGWFVAQPIASMSSFPPLLLAVAPAWYFRFGYRIPQVLFHSPKYERQVCVCTLNCVIASLLTQCFAGHCLYSSDYGTVFKLLSNESLHRRFSLLLCGWPICYCLRLCHQPRNGCRPQATYKWLSGCSFDY